MFRSPLAFFILLFFSLNSYGQAKKTQPGYIDLYNKAEKLYHTANTTDFTDSMALTYYGKAISLLIQEKKADYILADCFLKSGILEMSANKPEPALAYFHQAINLVEASHKLSDSLLFKPFIYAGTIQYNLNNLDSAVYFFRQAERVNDKYSGLDESERLFNKFGALYYETGDYNKSISYFEKALSLVQSKKPVNIYFVINYKNNIATALMKQGKYSQALEIFRELINYPQPDDILFYNIGNTYFEEAEYTLSLKYVRKISHLEFEKYSSLIKIFIRLQQYDSAQFYLAKAKNIYSSKKIFTSAFAYGIVLKYSGDLKAATGKPMEALEDYQSAIINLDPAFSDRSLSANPVVFSGLQNFSFLFETLVAKASTMRELGKSQQASNWLKQSVSAYGSALSLANHIERTYSSDDARLFLKTKINPATRDAVEAAIRLYDETKNPEYINTAFGFAEGNKATILQLGLRNLELTTIPGLPLALVSEEKRYRSILAKLEIHSVQVTDSTERKQLEREMHDVEISLASVQDKLDENPAYHNLKFLASSAGMDVLQKNLDGADEAILSYYFTADKLICFYITREGSGYSALPLNKNEFSNNVISTISALRNTLEDLDAVSRTTFRNMGTRLFTELIKPVFDKIKNKNRLIIIPYNEISYVPFEMLVMDDGSQMLKKFAISYNYTANFLTGNKPVKSKGYEVLAMAPFSDAGNMNLILPALPSSAGEIEQLPGKKLFGTEATKNQFTSLLGQFPVIHLATHAIANDSNLLGSYIEFYGIKNDAEDKHRLFEKEIYTFNMKSARLVILSACETGNGLMVNGEGVISLSRAFSYAGCKSVVTSLWKADEISISFITKRLHHYLQKGLPIDIALQKSKIDFLASSDIDARIKTPAFWANLVLIGDYQPVAESPVNWFYLAGIFFACSIAVYFAIKKLIRH
jgi:CHAT domain-containing protein/tetratricopeptide (TPR) repeat protein